MPASIRERVVEGEKMLVEKVEVIEVQEPNGITHIEVAYKNLDAEKVLHRLGKYGTYQMIIYAMSSFASILFAFETMIMSLIAADTEFSCISNNSDYEVVDRCTVRSALNHSLSAQCGTVEGTRLHFHDTQNATLTAEFQLVCDKAYWAQHGTSVFMIACMVASPLLSSLADWYGRRWTFLLSLWFSVLSNIACSMAPSYFFFLAFRFCAGLGAAGMGIGYVIQIESVTASFRTVSPLFSSFVWVFGYMAVGVMHVLIKNWRWTYFAIAAPGLISFGFYWLMPESIHWLITNNKTKEVSRYIKQSCRINRREIQLHDCQNFERIEAQVEATTTKRSFFDIFRHRALLFHLILHCYIMTCMNLSYWALSLFSVDLHEEEMVGYFLSGLVELPAGIVSIALLWYFGRRTVTFYSMIGQGACMFLTIMFPGKSTLTMSFPLLAKVFNSIAWTSEPLLLGEMSPTTVRNVFYGCIGFVGELGSVFAPYLNVLKGIHEMAPPFVITCMSLVAGIAALCSPETRDQRLPEDMSDFDEGPVYRRLFRRSKRNSHSKDSSPECRRRCIKQEPPALEEAKNSLLLPQSDEKK
ncbi:Major facilitator superfamily MFS-1 domain containing protein, protein [Aphelenchoides fujianensis]|nr:Major facilitator superfamily MFS-1 domain containing protein, protein [Aphelenchoides fujianensis]